MTKVFIGGSRHISLLNNDIRNRLEKIITNNLQVLLGDASGADKAMQSFFFDRSYKDVLIYCSGSICRNNVGNWQQVNVPVSSELHGLKFYMAKDSKMADDAEYGFMLWDGKSSGTLNNVLNLLSREKRTLLYFSPTKEFITVSKPLDLKQLLLKCDQSELSKIDGKIRLHKTIDSLMYPTQVNLELSLVAEPPIDI